jgi:LPXTG-motif cell wall-anchored protein
VASSELKRRAWRLWPAIAIFALLANPAFGGDEDQDPPYMIYIDPESGRYVTDDPAANAGVAETDRARIHADVTKTTRASTGATSLVLVGAGALLLALVVIVWRRRRSKFRAGHL